MTTPPAILVHQTLVRPRLHPSHSSHCLSRQINIPPVLTSWICNEFMTPSGDSTPNRIGDAYDNLAPNSGKVLCRVEPPSAEQIESAVTNAKRAAQEWSELSAWVRGSALRDMARIVDQNMEDLCELEALDSGLPISQIRTNHIPYCAKTLEYYASLIQSGMWHGNTIVDTPHAGGHADSFSYTRREPLGVCLGIGAWNYPSMGMMWKVAPALACGNAMIFKPSECTPITAPHIAHLFRDVLPPSLLQVLVGSGSVAETLLSHPDIHKVSVTGSLETGKAVARQATSTFKRVTLELGGKSPLLVFRDADMDSASRVAIDGNFVNNGEVCSNCTRIYAENTCIDEFVDRVLTHLETLPLQTGDNMDPVIKMGPLMMNPFHPTQHFDRVKGLIDRAKKDPNVGLLWGGNCFQSSQGAFFCEPTVFVAYSDEAEICQTEVFGPVMTVLAFDTEQEAITRANASIYGLAAGVMTRDLARAHRVAKQLQAGTVWINNWNLTPLEVGFGPYKQSGYGKELGMQALECYSQVKSVYVEMGAVRDFEE